MSPQSNVTPIRRTIPPGTYNRKSGCRDKVRVRGYSYNDERCENCPDRPDCMEATLSRLMSVREDLNRRLFLELDTEGWVYQGQAEKIPYPEWFDEWRQEIQTVLADWAGENDYSYAKDVVKTLHPATLHFLDKTWPDWRRWTKNFIDSVHVTDSGDVEKLKRYLRMPYFIIDSYMKEMTGDTWKVFCYIARRVTFDPTSNHFGRVWLRYDEIREWTGVKQPERAVKKLKSMGLLEGAHIRKRDNDQVTTTNQFTVTWFQRFKKKGVDGYLSR